MLTGLKLAPGLLLITLVGCSAGTSQGLHPSLPQNLGNGRATSFVSLDSNGTPTEVGVRLESDALNGLPAEGASLEFDLPDAAGGKNLPFNHITVDWNPHGHEPPGLYDTPHFDFHFYLISRAERDAIMPGPGAAAIAAAPAAGAIPPGYVSPPDPAMAVVPRMGIHWVNPTSPEFSPAGFSSTFIFGFANAKMNFLEPMITRQTLLSGENKSGTIALPTSVPKAGLYPTRWNIVHEPNGAIRITLDQLVNKS